MIQTMYVNNVNKTRITVKPWLKRIEVNVYYARSLKQLAFREFELHIIVSNTISRLGRNLNSLQNHPMPILQILISTTKNV